MLICIKLHFIEKFWIALKTLLLVLVLCIESVMKYLEDK